MRANCVICSDIFDEINQISAAACGHVYHSLCLTLWLDQSKSCPQCRSGITAKNLQKLYFNFPPASVTNSSDLENEVLNLKTQLSAKSMELQTVKKEKDGIVAFARNAEKRAEEMQQENYKFQSEISELRLQVRFYSKCESKLLKIEQMNVTLTNELQLLNKVQTIVNGTQKDVENILQEYNSNSEATKQLATYCTCLKRELQLVMDSKNKLTEQNTKLKQENGRFAAKVKFYEDALAISSTSTSNPVLKASNFSSEKKTSFDSTDSLVSNQPSSSTNKNLLDDTSINISPFNVPFNKRKFNLHIKTSSSVSTKITSKCDDDIKLISNPLLSVVKQNNENSVVRIGYNGLGGHSNFINTVSEHKKIKISKRKIC